MYGNKWGEELLKKAEAKNPEKPSWVIEREEKIKCYKCGKTKKLGYRKNYYKVYCVECAKDYKEWRSNHFWFCADDCPQEN